MKRMKLVTTGMEMCKHFNLLKILNHKTNKQEFKMEVVNPWNLKIQLMVKVVLLQVIRHVL